MFKSRKGIKQKYKITFVSASNVPDGSNVCVSWKRGAKKENKGSSTSKSVKSGMVEWNETISIICTLFKDGVVFDAKVENANRKPLTLTERCFYCQRR